MIEVDGVSHFYGAQAALLNVSLRFEAGEVVGLLGLNGAGKSTLIKIMTGCTQPAKGRATLNGLDVAAHPEARARLGFLPETPPLYPDMRVVEYLRFVARLKEIPTRGVGTAVADAMARVDLTDVSRKLLGNLSKGYRQRVGVAQALIGDPPALVLDEPTVGLDPAQMHDMRELISRCASSKRTVVFSSHILGEVLAVSDRIAILRRGRLAAFDSPDRFVASLAGGTGLYLKADAKRGDMKRALSAIPGVAEIELLPAEDGKPVEAVLTCDGGTDVRRLVFRAAVGGGWTILELRAVAPSVEDALGRVMAG
ncbi:MAG: ABC transporter ATP-binding protein [Planctomycetota bacterium]|jgi:ABC-2 type transport system ATP-binding protein|nr:ABC transporter ATP-binding protein [Planctomycetota bacterium]